MKIHQNFRLGGGVNQNEAETGFLPIPAAVSIFAEC